MNPIHLNGNLVQHHQREKRLKVSKACYTCRVKKIKCDGVQPCMQCKARRRPCSFSKDGVENQTQTSPDNRSVPPSDEEERPTKQRRLTASPPHRMVEEPAIPTISFQLDTRIAEQRAREQNTLRKVTQQLDKLSMMWPGEGKEEHWVVDTDLLFRDPMESPQSKSIHTSATFPEKFNPNLLNLYFRYRYTVFPILPKATFYRLLERRDPFITPLLLYSIYCNAAHFSNDEAGEASVYFKKAQNLLDSYIDTPSLSTVVALCLLSTYEPNRYSVGPHVSKNKSRIYCDMALRMCYDLNLHRRSSLEDEATLEDIELRKRVYWMCYCIDKVNSLISSRPVLLFSKDVEIDLPIILRSDDTTEYEITICLVEHIKLMQLAERALQLDFPDRRKAISTPQNEQAALELDQQLQYWLRSLPSHLQWTPLATDRDNVPTQPPANALVAHLHLVYNITELHVLQPYYSSTHVDIQQRCASVATNITQLTCAMADQPNFILSFYLIAEAIMSAVRTHIMSCADEKLNTARHARFMFQRSLRSLRSILHHRVNDTIEDFALSLEEVLVSADNGNSRNSSPKLHVLSPIIPRDTTPYQENLNSFQPTEDRWATTVSTNSLMRNNNTSNLYSYGLISPASSTASTPLDKSLTREDEFTRPALPLTTATVTTTATHSLTNTVYTNSQDSINPVNDSFTRSAVASVTTFTVPINTTESWKSNMMNTQQQQQQQQQHQQHNQSHHQQQQTDIYSNVWGSRADINQHNIFSTEMMDSSFVDTKHSQSQTFRKEKNQTSNFSMAIGDKQELTSTTAATEANSSEIYAFWNPEATQKKENEENEEEDEEIEKTNIIIPQSGRYGLGVYASAQQHHTDVIRQHIPELKSSHPSVRPVLLTHHGQVVVAGSSQNDIS